MIRISVTELELLRYFREHDYITSGEVIRRLRREPEEPKPHMVAGHALHAYLQNAKYGDSLTKFKKDGIKFSIDCEINMPLPEVREWKTEYQFSCLGHAVTLVGVLDANSGGHTIYDHKLTKKFNLENYADSLQWRAYLMMFGASKFVYNLFVGGEKNGVWHVKAFHQLAFHRYAGMEGDVVTATAELVQFFIDHVPERLTKNPIGEIDEDFEL